MKFSYDLRTLILCRLVGQLVCWLVRFVGWQWYFFSCSDELGGLSSERVWQPNKFWRATAKSVPCSSSCLTCPPSSHGSSNPSSATLSSSLRYAYTHTRTPKHTPTHTYCLYIVFCVICSWHSEVIMGCTRFHTHVLFLLFFAFFLLFLGKGRWMPSYECKCRHQTWEYTFEKMYFNARVETYICLFM